MKLISLQKEKLVAQDDLLHTYLIHDPKRFLCAVEIHVRFHLDQSQNKGTETPNI